MSDADLERLRALRRQSFSATPFLGDVIYWLVETSSTNDDCRRLTEAPPERSAVVLADRQTTGRGQYGRTWEVPAGLGVLMSFSVPRPPPENAMLTAWASAAIASMLERTFGLAATIKWPNDVLVSGRKIAGVLVEVGAVAVIGIGLNVLQRPEHFPPDARIPPTSIALETDAPLDRAAIAAALLHELEALAYPSLIDADQRIIGAWQDRLDVRPGQAVVATWSEGSIAGQLLDLHPVGGLRLQAAHGIVRLPGPRLHRIQPQDRT